METKGAIWLIIFLGVLLPIEGALQLAAFPARSVRKGQTVILQCTYSNSDYQKKHCVFVWSHSLLVTGHQNILYSSSNNPTISFSGPRGSRLTIRRVTESTTGRYMCHYICGGLHSSTRVDIRLRGPVPPRLSGNIPLRNPYPGTSPHSSTTTSISSEGVVSGTSHYGGLIALGAMVALLVLTALCAVKVSKQRCCDDNIQTHNRSSVDTEAGSFVTETSDTASVDEPPSYESMFNQTTQYFQGVMGNLFSRVWPGNHEETRVPKCTRCGQTRRLAPRRELSCITSSSSNLRSQENGAYYISVCCEQIPSPVDKPPEYWTWLTENKTTTMFTSQTAPPIYEQINQTVSPKTVTITHGKTKASSLSKKSNNFQRPPLVRSFSDTFLT